MARPYKYWTDEEDALLTLLWKDDSIPETEVAKRLNRSKPSITNRVKQLAIRRVRTHNNFGVIWSEEEDRLLRELYPSAMPVREIAKQLDRSKGSIINQALRLGLQRPPLGRKRPMPIQEPKPKETVVVPSVSPFCQTCGTLIMGGTCLCNRVVVVVENGGRVQHPHLNDLLAPEVVKILKPGKEVPATELISQLHKAFPTVPRRSIANALLFNHLKIGLLQRKTGLGTQSYSYRRNLRKPE
jgi:predicted transcriptional regulator